MLYKDPTAALIALDKKYNNTRKSVCATLVAKVPTLGPADAAIFVVYMYITQLMTSTHTPYDNAQYSHALSLSLSHTGSSSTQAHVHTRLRAASRRFCQRQCPRSTVTPSS
jgi:hypothetical protein